MNECILGIVGGILSSVLTTPVSGVDWGNCVWYNYLWDYPLYELSFTDWDVSGTFIADTC